MVVGESTDASAATQLAVVVRGMEMEFNMTEELAALVSVRETIYGCIFM
jgi:hypothetical protein